MVAVDVGQSESTLLRELVGDHEEEMGDVCSGFSDQESAAPRVQEMCVLRLL